MTGFAGLVSASPTEAKSGSGLGMRKMTSRVVVNVERVSGHGLTKLYFRGITVMRM